MNELKLLVLLVNSNKVWRKSELADKLGTSVRSIERYMVKLKDVGFIFKDIRGEVALQHSNALYNDLSQLVYFSEEDAAMLYNALDVIETNTRAKQSLREKLATIYSSSSIREKIIRLKSDSKMKTLMTAIEKHQRVILRNYSSPSSNTRSDRLVEAFQLTDGGKQVWCWEVESGKNKVFNLSRIEEVVVLKDTWKGAACHQAGFTDAFRMISFTGKTMPVTIRLNQMAYNLLKEEYPLTEADIEQTGDNEWTYSGDVASYKGIGRFVIGLADCIKIDTPALKEYLKNFCRLYIEEEI